MSMMHKSGVFFSDLSLDTVNVRVSSLKGDRL